MWAEAMLSTSVGMEPSSTWVVRTVDQQGEVELGAPWSVAERLRTPNWMCRAGWSRWLPSDNCAASSEDGAHGGPA